MTKPPKAGSAALRWILRFVDDQIDEGYAPDDVEIAMTTYRASEEQGAAEWEDVKTYSLQCNLNLGQGKRKIVELHIAGQTITMRDSDDHAMSIYVPDVRIQRRVKKDTP